MRTFVINCKFLNLSTVLRNKDALHLNLRCSTSGMHSDSESKKYHKFWLLVFFSLERMCMLQHRKVP